MPEHLPMIIYYCFALLAWGVAMRWISPMIRSYFDGKSRSG